MLIIFPKETPAQQYNTINLLLLMEVAGSKLPIIQRNTKKEKKKKKYLSWRVSKVKEDMKSGEISHQGAVRAVPRVECEF